MESERELNEKDLFALYGDYVAAHNTAKIAAMYANRGDIEDAERLSEIADYRLANIVSDLDALEINAYIASRLQQDRHEIVGRLRAAEHPTSWTRIGQALGMTKQSVHGWFNRGFQRPGPRNPTEPLYVRMS